MKTISILLLLIAFHSTAMAEKGVIVDILPDKLILSTNCEAKVNL